MNAQTQKVVNLPGPLGKVCKKCGADRWMFMRWKNGNPGQRCAKCATRLSKSWLKRHPDAKRNFGWRDRGITMTVEQYEALESAQDYRCAICRKPTENMVVDHDHQTSIVRGLLCRRCNVLAQDVETIRTVLAYIEERGGDEHVRVECETGREGA